MTHVFRPGRLVLRASGVSVAFAVALTASVEAAPVEPTTVSGVASSAAEFRADRLELDPRLSRLTLTGHVVIAVDRYRLTSDHLDVARGAKGIAISGGGSVALCGCPNPPVTLGFASAWVAPPTDLFLTQPTVRVAGVPVLWLPYLWLRSPASVGVLPLTLAWRGEDGLLLGSGIHVPLSQATALDLSAAFYAKGGADVEARLLTPRTSTVVRWDYLREGALAADLGGSSEAVEGATVAWSVDALRGARALTGPSLLEDVALRQDRARVAAGWTDGATIAGVRFVADAVRGGAADSLGSVGPGAFAGIGGAIGPLGQGKLDVGVVSLQGASPFATTLLSTHGQVRADLREGPLLLGLSGNARGIATLDDVRAGYSGAAGIGADAELPLMRTFGDGSLQHFIVPIISGFSGFSETRSPSIATPISDNGPFYAASAGLRTTLGEAWGSRDAVTASLRGGALGVGDSRARSAFAWAAGGQTRLLALESQGVVVGGSPASIALFNVRIGDLAGPFVATRAAEQKGAVPVLGRILAGGWDAPGASWLAPNDGWSVGGAIGFPWTKWLSTGVDADYDLADHVWLGTRGTLAYRHPCGCLGVTMWGGHRAGRRGVDSWLTVDLERP